MLFSDQDSATRRGAVLEALSTAVQFVDALRRGDELSVPVRYSPFLVLRLCLSAAVFISKVLHSSYRPYLDYALGRDTFSACISIFKQCSTEDNDMDGRATTMLAQLWAIHRDRFEASPDIVPRLSVKSRSFFSIVHDGLWEWRDRYAGKPSNGAPSLPPPLLSPISTNEEFRTSTPDEQEARPSPERVASMTAGDVGAPSYGRGAPVAVSPCLDNRPRLPSPSRHFDTELGLAACDLVHGQEASLYDMNLDDVDATQLAFLFPEYTLDPLPPM